MLAIQPDDNWGVPIEYADALDIGIKSWIEIPLSDLVKPKSKPTPFRRHLRRNRRMSPQLAAKNIVKHFQYTALHTTWGDSIVDTVIREALSDYTIYYRGWDSELTNEEIAKIRADPMTMCHTEGQINSNQAGTKKTVVDLYTIPEKLYSGRSTMFSKIMQDAQHLQYVREIDINNGVETITWEGWSTDKFNQRNMEKGWGRLVGFPSDMQQQYPLPRILPRRRLRRFNNGALIAAPAAPAAPVTPYEPNDEVESDHGELDLYEQKEKLGDDTRDCVRFIACPTRWLVTTYGKGDEVKTDVTVDENGDVARVNSITVANDNNAIFIDNGDDDEAIPVVEVMIADEYRDDFFFAYKAVANAATGMPAIAKLRIPSNATIMGTRFETKMRCNRALVEQIWEFELNNGVVSYTEPIGVASSCVYQKKSLEYTVGQWVELPRIDEIGMEHDRADRDACAPGIHWCFSQEDALRFHFVRVDCITNAEIFMDANQLIK